MTHSGAKRTKHLLFAKRAPTVFRMLGAVIGGAVGPWVTGLIYDRTGSYDFGFWIALALSIVSAIAIFIAAPRQIRLVAGRMPKTE